MQVLLKKNPEERLKNIYCNVATKTSAEELKRFFLDINEALKMFFYTWFEKKEHIV